MDKPRVFVTRRIPQPALDLLSEHAEVTVSPQDAVISRSAAGDDKPAAWPAVRALRLH